MLRTTRLRRERLIPMNLAQAPVRPSSDVERQLTVTELRSYALREPVSRRGYTIVKIQTQSGLAGFGECAAVSPQALEQAKKVVIGMPVTAFESARRQLTPVPGIEAAVNMALLDVIGQFAKAPVYHILGGPTRNKARAITALEGDSDEDLISSMKGAQQAGYRAFLVPLPPVSAPNQGQAFVHKTRKRMESLRAAGGETLDFALAGGEFLSPGDTASLCSALERFHLLWFDEPCRISNLSGLVKISSESVTPLGFGRRLSQGGQFQDLLRQEVVDVLRPDLSFNGISGIRKIAALAETYYVALAPHHDGGPIATASALHLAASIPNFFIQQIPFPKAEEDRRMRAALISRPVEEVKDGFVELPRGPGLGISVNEDALQKYRENAA
jgi:galactonate dehydratase